MTILEALERAKLIHAERAKEARADPARREPSAPNKRQKAEPAPTIVPEFKFQAFSLDHAECIRNRILIATGSGGDQPRALDSFRILRTRLRSRLGTELTASLGVVSAGPNEGKSLTAINLALSFANEKRRNVFLLDLDLRNPSICNYLGVKPAVEIGSYLSRTGQLEELFFTVGIANLVIAGGTHSHDNSSELLGGSALAELMAHIRGIDPHALVIIDLPPLLHSADAMVVVPHLTTTLLVVGEGVTRRENLASAAEILQGLPVAGVVLNRSSEAVEDYYG